jgi:hypothetical protein
MARIEDMFEKRLKSGDLPVARLFHDNHGCITHRRDGGLPESMTVPLENRHLDALQKLIDESNIAGLRSLSTLISKMGFGSFNLGLKHPSSTEEEHEQSYLDPYLVPDETKEAFVSISKSKDLLQPHITIATGTPACCASGLINKLTNDKIWQSLDNVLTLFCTPSASKDLPSGLWPDKNIFSSGSKMAALAVCRILDREVNPWAVVEDSLEIARYMAYFFDARVLVPLPEDEAIRRENARGFELPSILSKKTGRGQIEFGWSISDILSEYQGFLKNQKSFSPV